MKCIPYSGYARLRDGGCGGGGGGAFAAFVAILSASSCLLLSILHGSHKKGKLCTMRERRVNAEVDEGIEGRISGL